MKPGGWEVESINEIKLEKLEKITKKIKFPVLSIISTGTVTLHQHQDLSSGLQL